MPLKVPPTVPATDRLLQGLSVHRDYQRLNNPSLDDYLGPNPTSMLDSTSAPVLYTNSNPELTVDATPDTINTSTDADISTTIDPTDTINISQSLDALLASSDYIDTSEQNLDLLDSISQAIAAWYAKQPSQPHSWVYDYFDIQLIDSVFYTPKHSNIPKQEQRYCCKQCNWSVPESKKKGTTNLILYVAKHSINKHSISKPTHTVVNMFNQASAKQLLLPEQSIID
jgi:hypothetical protein